MGKLFRFLFGFFSLLIVLVVLAGVLVHFYFDPNDYKTELVELVKKQTGRDLVINKKMELSLFPWLAIKLSDVELKQAAIFGKGTFAKIDELKLRVNVKPLFSKELEVDTIILKGLTLNLEKDKNGITNWADLIEGAKQKKKVEKTSDDNKKFALEKIAVLGIELENANISWDDQQKGEKIQINGLDLNLGNLKPDQEIPIKLKANIVTNKPQVMTDLTLQGKIIFNKTYSNFKMDQANIGVGLSGQPIPAKKIQLNLAADIAFDQIKSIASLNNIDLKINTEGAKEIPFDNMEIALNTQSIHYQMLNNTLTIPAFNLVVNAQNSVSNIPFKQLNLTTKGSSLNYKGDNTAEIQGLVVNLTADGKEQAFKQLNLDLTSDLTWSGQKQQALLPHLAVVLKVSRQDADLKNIDLNLKGDLTWMGKQQSIQIPNLTLVVKADGAALPQKKIVANLNSHFKFLIKPLEINLQKLALKLNDHQINGYLMVQPNAGPKLDFDLNIDQVNLDQYLPAKTTEQPNTTSTTPAPVNEDPLAALRPLNINGKLMIKTFQKEGIKVKDILVKVKAKNGKVNISRMEAKVYEGQLKGSLYLDAHKKTPYIKIKQNLTGIQIGPILKRFANKDILEGKGDLKLNLTMNGLEPDLIKKTLNGTAGFIFYDGAIKGINLAANARNFESILTGKKDTSVQKTDFSELSGNAHITNGVIKNDDFNLMSQLVRVHGKGTVNLPQQTINYLLNAKLVQSLKGQGGMSFDRLPGVPVGIKLTGDLTNPKKEVRLGKALKQIANIDLEAEKKKFRLRAQEKQRELEEKLKAKLGKEVGGQLGETLNKELGGALKGLFGR